MSINKTRKLLCASAPLRELHHNADGGLSSDGIWSYAYDAEDQLRSVTSRSLTNGAICVRNTYDYRRRRISKTVQRLDVTTASPNFYLFLHAGARFPRLWYNFTASKELAE